VRNNLRVSITCLGFWAALTFPLCVAAQASAPQNQSVSHHHYKLMVVEPLGGPASAASGPGQLILNNRGTFVAYANTPAPNPNSNCFLPFGNSDCFVEHAVVWRNGTLTDLGVLPGGNSSQTDSITASGLIAGWSENGLIDPLMGLPEGRAVLWTNDGKIIDLGTLPGGTESIEIGANSRGQVVGFSNNDISDPFSLGGLSTQTRAFVWQDGVISDMGTLGGADALATNVNEAGQIAGISYTDSNFSLNCPYPLTTHAFFWERGQMTDVGTLGGSCSVIGWMNNRGQVTGDSNLAGDQTSHAFFWDKAQGLKDLGTLPGGSFSYSYWINDVGDVVGAGDNGSTILAILWNKGTVTNLGTLPGDCNSEALSINSGAQIVGHSSPDCIVDGNVVLWENGAAPVSVNTLVTPSSDVTAVYPLEINNRGEIAAHALTSTGDLRGVLLIPCDANHPNVEGCDYSLVLGSSTTASGSAKPARFSKANMMMRLHARMADRYRHF